MMMTPSGHIQGLTRRERFRIWCKRMVIWSEAIENWGALRMTMYGGLPLVGISSQFGFFLSQVTGPWRLLMELFLLCVGVVHFRALHATLSKRRIVLRKCCVVVEFVVMSSSTYDYAQSHSWSLFLALTHQLIFLIVALRRREY